MAIRDRVRRALNKSDSDSTISQTESNTTTATNTSSEASSLHNQPTNASQTPRLNLPWSRSDRNRDARKQEKEEERRRKAAKKKGTVHPRDRPLTEANLKNQEMLSAFDFSFGSSPNRLSQVLPAHLDDYGVSPCCTRCPSVYDDMTPDSATSQITDALAAMDMRTSTADHAPQS